MKTDIKFKIKKEALENSRVKVVVTIDAEAFETVLEEAKKKVLGDAKLNGFRDGKVPFDAFVKQYGEFPIRQEMGYIMVDKTYVQVIISEKIEAIGQPNISILSVNKGEDFSYQIESDILPEVKLPDYKNLAKEITAAKEEAVEDGEVENSLEELRRMRMTKSADGSEALPDLDEAFLKTVGDFKTADELKARIKENLLNEKKWRADEKRKGEIFEKLIAGTECLVPMSLVKNELHKIEEKIKGDLAQMGVSFENYLKHLKKTLPEWQEAETPNAKKSVILQLALHSISKKENIKVSEETVKNEVAHLVAQYKDLDPERARAYTEERMTNSLVAEFIVNGKVPDEKEFFGSHEGHNH